jgi:hypothetical protein
LRKRERDIVFTQVKLFPIPICRKLSLIIIQQEDKFFDDASFARPKHFFGKYYDK